MARDRKAPEERRQELVDAATKVFIQKGYTATTVSDITSKAGTAHGTFYVYFEDKESVFDAVAQEHVMQVLKTVTEIAEAPGKTALEKIAEILRVNSEPGLTGWLAKEFMKPHLRHLLARVGQKALEMFQPVLARVIQEAVDAGSIDVPFPEATASFLIGAGIQRAGSPGLESLSVDEWTRAYEDFARRVLGLKD